VKRERGSVSIVAIAIVAITLAIGLGATDLTKVLIAAARAQGAADAAALAAAQELALASGLQPAEAATEYASRNGAELLECRCDPGTLEAAVRVRVAVRDLILIGGDRSVEARAAAVVEAYAPP